jgi:hypothetical protein
VYVVELTDADIEYGAANRPKLPCSIRHGYDRSGLVTGHRLVNLSERQLFDFLSVGTRPTAVAQMASGERLFRNNCGHTLIAQFNGQHAADCW